MVHLKRSSSCKASAAFLSGGNIVSTTNVGTLRIFDSGKIVPSVAIIDRGGGRVCWECLDHDPLKWCSTSNCKCVQKHNTFHDQTKASSSNAAASL